MDLDYDYDYYLRDYKNRIKFKNEILNDFPLYGQLLSSPKNFEIWYAPRLKWDRDYNESNPDLTKDFHVEISGDCFIITG